MHKVKIYILDLEIVATRLLVQLLATIDGVTVFTHLKLGYTGLKYISPGYVSIITDKACNGKHERGRLFVSNLALLEVPEAFLLFCIFLGSWNRVVTSGLSRFTKYMY